MDELRQCYAEFNNDPRWDGAVRFARELLQMCEVVVHEPAHDLAVKFVEIVAPTGKKFVCPSPSALEGKAAEFYSERYWL